MEAKHTPGPWGLWTGTPFGDHGMITDDEFGRHIAKIVNGAPETEANARLLAAAPDLLEALNQAEMDIEALKISMNVKDGHMANTALDRIRAAIAKATK